MSNMKNITKNFINKAGTLLRESPRHRLLKLMPKNSICAEIGVWKGEFSKEIIRIVKPRMLHLIDPWRYQPEFKERLYGGAYAKNQGDMDGIYADVLRLFGQNENVSLLREDSSDAATGFADEYFDWVYIDGNHYYEFVKKDLEMFYPKVKSGGFVTGDDYLWTGPELKGDLPVKRAVDEFTTRHPGIAVRIISTQFIIQKL
jgi:hypothetical protein